MGLYMKPDNDLPAWVENAANEMREAFGVELWALPVEVKTSLLTVACEAEPEGELAVRGAVFDLWRKIRRADTEEPVEEAEAEPVEEIIDEGPLGVTVRVRVRVELD